LYFGLLSHCLTVSLLSFAVLGVRFDFK